MTHEHRMSIALILDAISATCIIAGLVFFVAGTLGVLRFPDVYNRLHAMTKADSVGLGLVVLGLAVQSDDWFRVVELAFIWSLVMLAGSTAAHLIARTALRGGLQPWERR